jgi:hypothetical protein
VSGAADVTVLATGGTSDMVYNLAGRLGIGPPATQRHTAPGAEPLLGQLGGVGSRS